MARPPSSPTAIALDIETCPLPEERLSKEQRARLESEMDYRRSRSNGELSGEELESEERLARSTHGMLAWTCCVSVVRQEGKKTLSPRSFTASDPSEEAGLLDEFWAYADRVPGKTTWVTFNGSAFDTPFLQMRSLARRVEPARCGLNDTYPYSHEPHADLMKLFGRKTHFTLGQLCAHLGIESPKGEVSGEDVAPLVRKGKTDVVANYCEDDALATLRCWQAARPLLEKLE